MYKILNLFLSSGFSYFYRWENLGLGDLNDWPILKYTIGISMYIWIILKLSLSSL